MVHGNESDILPIGEGYAHGKNLIYDCEKGVFICAYEQNKFDCIDETKLTLNTRKNFFRCRFFKTFESTKDCHQFVKFKLYQAIPNMSFCYNYQE